MSCDVDEVTESCSYGNFKIRSQCPLTHAVGYVAGMKMLLIICAGEMRILIEWLKLAPGCGGNILFPWVDSRNKALFCRNKHSWKRRYAVRHTRICLFKLQSCTSINTSVQQSTIIANSTLYGAHVFHYYTGCKKIRIQTLRVCRGDKMKPFCYVTNI